MRVRHVAIYVPDLREAEEHYAALFDLEVLFREVREPDGTWTPISGDHGHEDPPPTGGAIGMVALQRDQFVLALFSSPAVTDQLHALGLLMDEAEIAAVAARLPRGTRVEGRAEGWLSFVDRYGMRWQLSARERFMPSRRIPPQRSSEVTSEEL